MACCGAHCCPLGSPAPPRGGLPTSLLKVLLWCGFVLHRQTARSEQDSNIYGMLVDSQKMYASHAAARDEIRANGCFNGYSYSFCESIDSGPGLANEGFHWRSAGVGAGRKFCLQCCNYNRQLRMFTETWNLRCPIGPEPEIDPQAFEMEFHFLKRRSPDSDQVVSCKIPRRPDRQRVTLKRLDTAKPIKGYFRLGIPACQRIRNRKYKKFVPTTWAPTPAPTPWANQVVAPIPTPIPTPPPVAPPPPTPPTPPAATKAPTPTPGSLCTVAGKYRDLFPPYACLTCIVCPTGEQLNGCRDNNEGACGACAGGRFKNTTGTWDTMCAPCPACPLGQLRSGCGGAVAGACVDCMAGRYSTTADDSNYQQVATCELCNLCPTGWWRSNCGKLGQQTTAGVCTPCGICPNGKFRSGCAACKTKPGDSLDPVVQQYGNNFYESAEGEFCGSQGWVQRLSPGSCAACPTGKYKLLGDLQIPQWNDTCTDCQPCGGGHQREQCGASSPGSCVECAANTYKTGYMGLVTLGNGWNSTCSPCRPGFVQDYTGQESCIAPDCNAWDPEKHFTYWSPKIHYNAIGNGWEELQMYTGGEEIGGMPGGGFGEAISNKLQPPVNLLREHTLNVAPAYGPFTAKRTPMHTPGMPLMDEWLYDKVAGNQTQVVWDVTYSNLGFNAPQLQVDTRELVNGNVSTAVIDGYRYDLGRPVGVQMHGYLLTMEVAEWHGEEGFDFWREVQSCFVNTTERDYGLSGPSNLYESYRLKKSAAPRTSVPLLGQLLVLLCSVVLALAPDANAYT